MAPETAFCEGTPPEASGEARPLAFALGAAYPNPASGATALPFTLAESAETTVTVRDVLGREVATVLNATLPAEEHTATWDARGVSGGVYVVTLRAAGQTATQRITIAR